MRHVQGVGIWPVAFTGAARFAGPVCKDGHVIGFHNNWKPWRSFPIDMAGFAINLKKLLNEYPEVRFRADIKPGFLETTFLEQLTTVEELEPRAQNCSKVKLFKKLVFKACLVIQYKTLQYHTIERLHSIPRDTTYKE